MSLFQCAECGCCENTALSNHAYRRYQARKEGLPPRDLCSACDPSIGKWHDEFDRVFLPPGEFKTNQRGNLEHAATGSEKFRDFAIGRAARASGKGN